MAEKTLAGNVALVTGSGRGIGRTIAERLAELGADVAIHDISEEAPAEFGEATGLHEVLAGIDAHGVRSMAETADIGDQTQVRRLVERVESVLGPITILVNCAGGDIAAKGGKPKPNDALGIPIEDTRAIFDRNLIGTILVCQAVCRPCKSERGGRSSTSPRSPRTWARATASSTQSPRPASSTTPAASPPSCARTTSA
jgi:3-oxoacyl-[acyl-carrier protein] reductase